MNKNVKRGLGVTVAAGMILGMGMTSLAEEKTVIGVTLMDSITEFGIGLHDYMEAYAEEQGDIEITIVDAGGDAEKQVSQVESFISKGVDVIIMQPQEQDACSPAITKAKDAGIPIVNCNSLTTTEPDAYVGSDDTEAAEIAMSYIAEQLGGKGNVAMMHGHAGQTAEVKRTEGAKAVLEEYPDMTLIDEQTANWDRAEAMTLMENWLQAHKDEIDAVFCQNDEMAMGALNALVQANKKEDILVVGVDAIEDALTSIKDGKLDATVYQDCKGQAEGAVEVAYKLANGETVEKETMIPFILVTADNVDEYLG